jgi:hypothetical protein
LDYQRDFHKSSKRSESWIKPLGFRINAKKNGNHENWFMWLKGTDKILTVPDPDWIRIQSGQWIRIQESENDP